MDGKHPVRLWFLLLVVTAACGSVREPNDVDDVDAGLGDTDAASTGAMLEVTGGPLDFAGVAVGQRSVAINLTVRNRGDADAGPLRVMMSGDAAEFELLESCAAVTLAPAETCRIAVMFRPMVGGPRHATLAVSIDGLDGAVTVALDGRGLIGALVVTPPTHHFGAIDLGTDSAPAAFEVENTGDATSGALSLSVTAATMRLAGDTCSGTMLAAGARCTFGVVFTPSAFDPSIGSVEISGGIAGETAASLAGRGQAVVTVTRAGTGTGTITSTPAGIDCGASCTGRFDTAPVTLVATPAPGHAFMGFGGACIGAACTLPLASPSTNVTATFEPLQTLTVNAFGGTVNVQPPGADCTEATCTYELPRTTQVRLVPTPPEGGAFRRWYDGACSSQMFICNTTITNNTTVTASFCPVDDICCFSPGSPGCI